MLCFPLRSRIWTQTLQLIPVDSDITSFCLKQNKVKAAPDLPSEAPTGNYVAILSGRAKLGIQLGPGHVQVDCWSSTHHLYLKRKNKQTIFGLQFIYQIYKLVMWAAMMYDLEMVALTKSQEVELRMLRFSLGVTRMDEIRNEHIW